MQVDPFGAAFRRDPYPTYRALREDDPVHWSAANAWIITRYADVRAMLTDARLAHWTGGQDSPFGRILGRWVRLMDPRTTSHLRPLAAKTMSAEAAESLHARIKEVLDLRLGEAERAGAMDVVKDLAEPLTLAVVSDLLGVPRQESEPFQQLARKLMGSLFALVGGGPGAGSSPSALQEFALYILRLVEQKQHDLGNDLLSALIEARRRGDDISEEDYLAFSAIFLFAGQENMMNFIGNAILALIEHPDQWRRLRAEPSLIRNAVEELLRYDSPVQFVNLVARERLEIEGRVVEPGDALLVAIGSANRDPAQFQDPDRLLVTRSNVAHLTFGAGALYCMGAALARVEGRMAVEAIVQRFEPAKLVASDLRWRSGPGILRGLLSLPVAVAPAAGRSDDQQNPPPSPLPQAIAEEGDRR